MIFGITVVHQNVLEILKKKILVLAEGLTDDINDRMRKFTITFTKSKTKVCLNLHCNIDESICT